MATKSEETRGPLQNWLLTQVSIVKEPINK